MDHIPKTQKSFLRSRKCYKALDSNLKNHEVRTPQIQNFGSTQDPIKRLRRLAEGWEKIFINHLSDKGLISRMKTS